MSMLIANQGFQFEIYLKLNNRLAKINFDNLLILATLVSEMIVVCQAC